MSNVRSAVLLGALFLGSAVLVHPAPARAQDEDTQAKIRTSIQTMVQAIEEGNDPMRNRMFFELRIIGSESVPALIELMKDDRVKVREYAIHTVSYIDDPRWIDPVVNILQNDPEASTRAMACRALGRTQDTPVLQDEGKAKAWDAIMKAFQEDDDTVKLDAAWALGWFGDPRARPALEKAAQGGSELVSFFAKNALEDIDHAEKMRQSGK